MAQQKKAPRNSRSVDHKGHQAANHEVKDDGPANSKQTGYTIRLKEVVVTSSLNVFNRSADGGEPENPSREAGVSSTVACESMYEFGLIMATIHIAQRDELNRLFNASGENGECMKKCDGISGATRKPDARAEPNDGLNEDLDGV